KSPARERGYLRRRSNFSNSVVATVRHIDIPRAVHGEAGGRIETSGASDPIRASWGVIQTSKNSCGAVGSDFADRVMRPICGVDVSRAVDCYTSHLSSFIRWVRYYTTYDGIGDGLAHNVV